MAKHRSSFVLLYETAFFSQKMKGIDYPMSELSVLRKSA